MTTKCSEIYHPGGYSIILTKIQAHLGGPNIDFFFCHVGVLGEIGPYTGAKCRMMLGLSLIHI